MKKHSVLLIGLGRIASLLEKDKLRYHPCTHAGVLFHPFGKKKFALQAILDTNPQRVKEFVKQWQLAADTLLLDPQSVRKAGLDLAIIASNTGSHYENILFAIDCGIKHFIIEKPVTMTLPQAIKIQQLQQKKKLVFWINHERRYHPVYNKVKEYLECGKYGRIKTIRASVLTSPLDPEKNYGLENTSPLLHDGTHALDYIHYLLGMPDSVYSSCRKSDARLSNFDQTIALLQYKNGTHVFFEAGGMRNYFQFEIDIQTEQARFILSNDGHFAYLGKKSKLYDKFSSLTPAPGLLKTGAKNANPFINLYREVDDYLAQKSDVITGSLQDNIEIMKMIEDLSMNSKKVITK